MGKKVFNSICLMRTKTLCTKTCRVKTFLCIGCPVPGRILCQVLLTTFINNNLLVYLWLVQTPHNSIYSDNRAKHII